MADDSQNKLPADNEALAGPILEALSEEKHDAVIRVARQISKFHSGPLPDPDTLRAYATLIPNGAERIMALVEGASTHRHAQEAQLVASENALDQPRAVDGVRRTVPRRHRPRLARRRAFHHYYRCRGHYFRVRQQSAIERARE